MDYRVGHIAYQAKDMKATLDFYTRVLGFKHLFSLAGKENEPWIEYVGTPDGRFIELFHHSHGNDEPLSSYLHLCLEVDDCAAAVAELEGKGGEIWKPLKVGKDGNKQAWVHDPDGREIEIMELAADSQQGAFRKTLK